MARQRIHRSVLPFAALASLAVGVVTIAGPVSAVSRAGVTSATCPAAYPVHALRVGMSGYGLTTDNGTTPHRFAVRVLGVLHEGIAPNVDMVLVRADSRAIRAAGGIWSGMSGSPVYANDGRLIGAVAYGLSFGASPVAGVTPAAAMYEVRGFPTGTGASFAAHVSLTPALRARVATEGGLTAQAVGAGMSLLPTPVAVSGVSPRQLAAIGHQVGSSEAFRFFAASAAPTTSVPADSIRPGSPFAVGVSYGSFTYAGIGTTTAVCGRQVLAFGHPMMAFGSTTESAHLARVLFVQKETLGASFVVANVGGVVGRVTQDRLTAVRAELGAPGQSARIHVDVYGSTGLHRVGTTRAPVTSWVALAAANAAFGGVWSAMQMDSMGSAWVSWTVTGHRAHGKSWSYTRTDNTDSQYGTGQAVGDMLYFPLMALVGNAFEKVTVDTINIRANATQAYRECTLTGLKVLVGSEYVDVTPSLVLQAAPGDAVSLRAQLTPYQGAGGSRSIELTLPVPADAQPGATGQVVVMGGADSGRSGEVAALTATSFDDVLAQLRATPQNNRVYAELDLPDAMGNPASVGRDSGSVGQVVRGTITLQIQVAGGEPRPAG